MMNLLFLFHLESFSATKVACQDAGGYSSYFSGYVHFYMLNTLHLACNVIITSPNLVSLNNVVIPESVRKCFTATYFSNGHVVQQKLQPGWVHRGKSDVKMYHQKRLDNEWRVKRNHKILQRWRCKRSHKTLERSLCSHFRTEVGQSA